jgi:hypothetical protein
MADEKFFPDFFVLDHCEAETRKGTICKMVSIYLEKATGKHYCDTHAVLRWRAIQEEMQKGLTVTT